MVLEDMHWSDVSSLRMLTYAAEALRDRPVLFVVTVRNEASPRPALTEALAGFSRLGARRLALAPLGAEEVASLVEDVIGDVDTELVEVLVSPQRRQSLLRPRDGPAPRGPGRAQCRRRRGARGAGRRRRRPAAAVPAPRRDTVRETLSIAAVLGRDFDAGLIAAAAGRPVLDDLDEAMAAGVVRDGEQPGTGRFVHALARETLYADLPAGQRARRHAAVAQALVERLPRQDGLVSEVAHHFSRAALYLPDLLDAGRRAHPQRRALRGAARRVRGGHGSCGCARSSSTSAPPRPPPSGGTVSSSAWRGC